MAMFIQERFEIDLEAEDLVRDNLARLSSMIALIDRKQSATAA
jgi:acyl carrier protein